MSSFSHSHRSWFNVVLGREADGSWIPFTTRVLLVTHSLFWFAINLVSPFLGIFYISQLQGVTLTEVGISSLIFYLSFGLLGPVVGIVSDSIKGLKDEVVLLIFGYLARGFLLIWFATATNAWHLYMFEFLLGAFRAISGPADKVLYAKSLQRKPSATLWGLDESLVNLASAIGSGIGGYVASLIGFRWLLVVAGTATVIAGLINFLLLKYFKARR